jgi:3-hydroxybutyryl-CoA dehydrogenase
MHFFNPVHSMRLVEVVAGIDTATSVLEHVADLARAWGKVVVIARSTPGFIVNRIARPFYAEALMLLQEGRAPANLIDSAMRGAGFKMGPCELMDLIGHDVNFAVTQAMFQASFADRRFTPSFVQQELVDSGRLGRKSGRGFYEYPGASPSKHGLGDRASSVLPRASAIVVRGSGELADALALRFGGSPIQTHRQPGGGIALDFVLDRESFLTMDLTDGRTAAQLAANQPSRCRGVFDWIMCDQLHATLAVAFSDRVSAQSRAAVVHAFQLANIAAVEMADSPALIVARTISMLVNESADAVQQNVCSVEAVNVAMRLGVNYPEGPFEWLETVGTQRVVAVLENLADYYRGERYRVSPWLQQRRWGELSGAHGQGVSDDQTPADGRST